jgi:chromosome segregation ATPase
MEEALRLSLSEARVAKRDYTELYDQFKLLATHSQQLQRQNEVLTEKCGKYKKKCREFEAQRKSFEDDVTHLEMASTLLQKRERDMEEMVEGLKSQILALKGMSELLETDNTELRRVIDTDMIPLNAHYQHMEKVEEEYRTMVKHKDALQQSLENEYVRREEFAEMMTLLDEVNSKNVEMEKSLSDSRRREAELSGALRAENERVHTLTREVADLQAQQMELKQLRERTHSHEETLRANFEQITTLESAKASLLTQLGNVKLELRRERDALKPFQDQIVVLKSSLSQCEDKHNTRLAQMEKDRSQMQQQLHTALEEKEELQVGLVLELQTHLLFYCGHRLPWYPPRRNIPLCCPKRQKQRHSVRNCLGREPSWRRNCCSCGVRPQDSECRCYKVKRN